MTGEKGTPDQPGRQGSIPSVSGFALHQSILDEVHMKANISTTIKKQLVAWVCRDVSTGYMVMVTAQIIGQQ